VNLGLGGDTLSEVRRSGVVDLKLVLLRPVRWSGAAVAERVRVRELSNDEGQRLLRVVRRSSGSVVRVIA
jgi:hypothetical protein